MSADFPEVEIIKAHPKRKMATSQGRLPPQVQNSI